MTENVTNTQNNTLKLKPLGKDSADSSGHEFIGKRRIPVTLVVG